MKLETSELHGAALDWAVARCEFPDANTQDIEVWVQPLPCDDLEDFKFQPSTIWAQGGPIIEREKIECLYDGVSQWYVDAPHGWYEGPTPLIAAMRCYCCATLGDEIDIPEELCQQQSS